MSETRKEFVEVTVKLAEKAVKAAATVAFLITVMPPIFAIGCIGTIAVFACETGGKVVEVAMGMHMQRKRRKK
jgi:Fe2+ transport system protein B